MGDDMDDGRTTQKSQRDGNYDEFSRKELADGASGTTPKSTLGSSAPAETESIASSRCIPAPMPASRSATPASDAPAPGGAGRVERATGEPTAGAWATGGWERNFQRDDKMLRSCGLFCKRVEADGACLFRAFSDQLEGDGGAEHLLYRERCVSFLEAHRNDFAPFVEINFRTYCARLREPAAWGGHVEAQALSRALGVNAIIHLPAEAERAEDVPRTAIEVMNFDASARCIQLCYHPNYHAGPHYNSVRRLVDRNDGVPPSATLTEVRESIAEALKARSRHV